MFSVRTLARSAPRALNRMTASTLRQAARPVFKPAAVGIARPAAAFSTTTASRKAASAGDEELVAKLDSEIGIEEDMKANDQEPSSVKDFLANSPFELIDTDGQEVVKLVRKYNDEQITVSFSIADITNYDPYNEDPALGDEEDIDNDAIQNSNKQSHVQSTGGARSAPAEEDIENDEGAEFDEEPSAPINLNIIVEKPGKAKGALNIGATAQDGAIVVDNMFYYEDAKVARSDAPEDVHKRQDIYPGPPFGSLDEDLQVLMERFLEERGITQNMAVFVPDYVDVKEQKEYVRWLNNVKGFIGA